MEISHTEAIVLRQLAFKDYDRVLTLFSPLGLIKLFVKSGRRNYLHNAALSSPMTLGDFSFRQGRSELNRFIEGRVVKHHLALRDRLELLKASEEMASALLLSQWPGKAAPQLFSLFACFLDYLPQSRDPMALSCAFWLKILRHEGVLQLSSLASPCARLGSEQFRVQDAPPGALNFSEEEEELLMALAYLRSLQQIDSLSLTASFQEKIKVIFYQVFD